MAEKSKKILRKKKPLKQILVRGREGAKDDFMAVLKRMVTSPKTS